MYYLSVCWGGRVIAYVDGLSRQTVGLAFCWWSVCYGKLDRFNGGALGLVRRLYGRSVWQGVLYREGGSYFFGVKTYE